MKCKCNFILIAILFLALISPLSGSSKNITVIEMPQALLNDFNAAMGFIASYNADGLFNLMSDSVRSDRVRESLVKNFEILKDNQHFDYTLNAISFSRISDEHYETIAELIGVGHSVAQGMVSITRSTVKFHWEKQDGTWKIIYSEL